MRRALPILVATFLAFAAAGTAEASHRHSRSCGHSYRSSGGYYSPGYYSSSYYYEPAPVVVYRPYYRPSYVPWYRPYSVRYHRPYYRPSSYFSLHFGYGR